MPDHWLAYIIAVLLGYIAYREYSWQSGLYRWLRTHFRKLLIVTVCCVTGFVLWRGHSAQQVHDGSLPKITPVGVQRATGPIILFVHGFTGDGRTTWINETTKAFWPDLVAADINFEGASIAAYCYDTTLFDESIGLDGHARQMTEVLKREGILNRPFVFVCHSMGGLLVRRFLLMNPELGKNVQAICYFGTPFAGSQLAALGRLITNNQTVAEMMQSNKVHSWLDEQTAQWRVSPLSNIPSYGGVETLDYCGIRVVTESSMAAGINKQLTPLRENHLTLCKPADENSFAYTCLVNAYNATTLALDNQRVKSWPDVEFCKQKIAEYGYTEDNILRPKERAVGTKSDISVTIDNGPRLNPCVVFCNASALYKEDGNIGNKFQGVQLDRSFGWKEGRILDGFSDTTGWFLIFLRYRDENDVVQDDAQCVKFLFASSNPFIRISRNSTLHPPMKLTVEDSTPQPNRGKTK